MANRYIENGDYQLNSITLYTNTIDQLEIDLINVMMDMTIYESIFNTFMSGNITIVDTSNSMVDNAIGNGEKIVISYQTAGVETPTIYTGLVYKVKEPFRLTDNSTGFTLYFTSPESLKSIGTRVFNGYTEEISSIAQKLFDKYGSEKKINITSSMNIENYVFTGHTVTEALQLLADQSTSDANLCGYMFYEDMDQFNFVPIELLYLQEPVVEYFDKLKGSFDDINKRAEESFGAYQSFELKGAPSFSANLKDGEYGSSWGLFSTYDKTLTIYNYSNAAKYDYNKTLGKGPRLLSQSEEENPNNRLVIKYASNSTSRIISEIDGQMAKLRSGTITAHIGVFGDSTLRVGSVCIANIPNWSSLRSTPSNHLRDIMSGKFLIAEIKHNFTRNLYTQQIKIIKDAYEEMS